MQRGSNPFSFYEKTTPVAVKNCPPNVIMIACGSEYALALTGTLIYCKQCTLIFVENGDVYSWGRNTGI